MDNLKQEATGNETLTYLGFNADGTLIYSFQASSAKRARNKKDKLDNQYGGYLNWRIA